MAALSACWSEPDTIDGFTPEQCNALRDEMAVPAAPDPCAVEGLDHMLCGGGVVMGQNLFFDPSLSATGAMSCATCHTPEAWYVDRLERSPKANGQLTARNTVTVVNVAYKLPGTYTWLGVQSAREVIDTIALPKAMGATPEMILRVATDARYSSWIGLFDMSGISPAKAVSISLEVYMRQLVSINSPFDQYLAGDRDRLDAAAKRGFALFAGRAMCIECHSGPMLTDDKFHVTGVAQTVADPGHDGAFLTPSLRNISRTGPYMHGGSLATLSDVLEFYRWGGATSGYPGVKDPLMSPLDLTDDEYRDLQAFLESLAGDPVPARLTKALP